jgi:hypothetical protein
MLQKVAFAIIAFKKINANEINSSIDNIQWLSIHFYVVQSWKRIPIILCVDHEDVSITFNNIFVLMLKFCWNLVG